MTDKPRSRILTGGMDAIAQERQRQIEAEGFDAAHDDTHARGELAQAAACYLIHNLDIGGNLGRSLGELVKVLWPRNWSGWFKPRSRRADLVRAGALIAAEIDRLDRAEAERVRRAVVGAHGAEVRDFPANWRPEPPVSATPAAKAAKPESVSIARLDVRAGETRVYLSDGRELDALTSAEVAIATPGASPRFTISGPISASKGGAA